MKRILLLLLLAVCVKAYASSNVVTARSAHVLCDYLERPVCQGRKSLVAVLFYSSKPPKDSLLETLRRKRDELGQKVLHALKKDRKRLLAERREYALEAHVDKRQNGIKWHNDVREMRKAFIKAAHQLTAVRFVEVDLESPGNRNVAQQYCINSEQPTVVVFMDGVQLTDDQGVCETLELDPARTTSTAIERFVRKMLKLYMPLDKKLRCVCEPMTSPTPASFGWGTPFQRYAMWPYRGPIYGAPYRFAW